MAYTMLRPSVTTASDLSDYQYYHLMLDGDGLGALATGADTTATIGLIINKPNATEGAILSLPGEMRPAKVGTSGTTAGNPVCIDTTIDGTVETVAGDTDVVVGWAMEDGVSGEIVTIITCTPFYCTDASKQGYGL